MDVFYKSTKIKKRIKLNEHFFKKLKNQRKLNYYKNSYGVKMWSFKMRDFFNVATKMLNQNIYCYLEKKPKLKKVHNV